MTKKELIEYCLTFPSTYEDYPFDEITTVIRHHCHHGRENKKIFALFGEKSDVPYINLKCEPMRADFFRSIYKSVTPAWHMNKVHWNTVSINGDVEKDDLFSMIEHSYDLTRPKIKK